MHVVTLSRTQRPPRPHRPSSGPSRPFCSPDNFLSVAITMKEGHGKVDDGSECDASDSAKDWQIAKCEAAVGRDACTAAGCTYVAPFATPADEEDVPVASSASALDVKFHGRAPNVDICLSDSRAR